jgi:hypothetical protein
MAAPIAEVSAEIRLLQIDGVAFKALVEQKPDRLEHVGLARAIFAN